MEFRIVPKTYRIVCGDESTGAYEEFPVQRAADDPVAVDQVKARLATLRMAGETCRAETVYVHPLDW